MPGERTFYLQAKEGIKISSVSLEKAKLHYLLKEFLIYLKK